MSLGLMVQKQPDHKYPLESREGSSYIKTNLDGSEGHTFSVDLIEVFDDVAVNNDLKLSTDQQEQLFLQYFEEAEYTSSEDQSGIIIQLDEYFGGYYGEEDDNYVKLYSKC